MIVAPIIEYQELRQPNYDWTWTFELVAPSLMRDIQHFDDADIVSVESDIDDDV